LDQKILNKAQKKLSINAEKKSPTGIWPNKQEWKTGINYLKKDNDEKIN
jgi:hypothetical protein